MKRKLSFVMRGLLAFAVVGGVMVLPASPAAAAPPTGVWLTIRPAHSGKCLDVVNGSTSNGARIQQWTCTSGSHRQQFQVVPSSVGGLYFIKPRHSGKCLDVLDGSSADGAPFQQWQCNGIWQQHFRFTAYGDGSHAIVAYGGRCADIAGASGSNGARLQQWTCLGGPGNQRFFFG